MNQTSTKLIIWIGDDSVFMGTLVEAPLISNIWKYNTTFMAESVGSVEVQRCLWCLGGFLLLRRWRKWGQTALCSAAWQEDGLFSNINIPKNLGVSLPLQSLGKQATEEVPQWKQQGGHTEKLWKETAAILAIGHLPFVCGFFPLWHLLLKQ